MDFNATEMKELNTALKKAFSDLEESCKRNSDALQKAIDENKKEGTLHGETSAKVTELSSLGIKIQESVVELKQRMLDVEQKAAKRPGGGDERPKSIGQIVADSDEFKAAASLGGNARSMQPVNVGSFHKAAIFNDTLNNDQPLVSRLRLPSVIVPGLRRMTVRDLLPQTPTNSNYIEFAKENVYTNSAGPQYDASPGSTEGAIKPESAITFTIAGVGVITLAHWIPASRQVLSDAPMLQGYIDGRLRYGLALAEETAILNGDGTAGTLNGLMNNATAFNAGSTNQTILDTLLKAQLQVSLSYYEATGFVLHPTDWTNLLLLKDTQGRYLFADPHQVEMPRVWGKDVVPTQAMTSGQFLCGAFNLAAEIFDREDATVRVAEQHADFFVRNMVAILAEERLALAVYRAAALVKGSVSNAG